MLVRSLRGAGLLVPSRRRPVLSSAGSRRSKATSARDCHAVGGDCRLEDRWAPGYGLRSGNTCLSDILALSGRRDEALGLLDEVLEFSRDHRSLLAGCRASSEEGRASSCRLRDARDQAEQAVSPGHRDSAQSIGQAVRTARRDQSRAALVGAGQACRGTGAAAADARPGSTTAREFRMCGTPVRCLPNWARCSLRPDEPAGKRVK